MQNKENGKAPAKGAATNNKKPEIEQVGWIWVFLVLACFVIVPLFVYWCWICVEFNKGALLLPSMHDLQNNFSQWLQEHYWKPILAHAIPTRRALIIYTAWLAMQSFLAAFAPGPKGEGVDLGNGKKLIYKYNGQFAFIVTLITAATLHLTGLFRLSILYDEYPALLSTCLLYSTLIIALIHGYALITGKVERPSNSLLYDYFMGPILNPRIGDFDLKFFFELRPGIMHWFFTTVAMAVKMYEDNGTISAPMCLIVFYHFCFTNACYKGEQCVPFSMDIIYEKFGWMLLMLDIVMVPFIFPLQAFYLLKMGPSFTFSPLYLALVCSMHCLGYFIFDTANSQKDYFREKEQHGHITIKKGWPVMPWGELENPEYIKTERGTKLLVSGWWGYARHMNYTGDILMAWSWALTCGVGSYFPFAYATFYLTPLLIHRERRDDDNCAKKYGADWEKYKKRVPYRLIPYIY